MEYVDTSTGRINLERYLGYLQKNSHCFPSGAKRYVRLPYLFDLSDERCPHDSWMENVIIKEEAHGERSHLRNTVIEANFKGSYHNGCFKITYNNVFNYEISMLDSSSRRDCSGKGDWMVDEVIFDNGKIIHEIMFSKFGAWRVVCEDIDYLWKYY